MRPWISPSTQSADGLPVAAPEVRGGEVKSKWKVHLLLMGSAIIAFAFTNVVKACAYAKTDRAQ
jgi:hypothetical protein